MSTNIDIVKMLRSPASVFYEYGADEGLLLKTAADEIENLAARVEELEKNQPRKNLENEIRSLLNSFSAENDSNTPDFILARFMMECLSAFNYATKSREYWYGRSDNHPAESV